MPLYKVNAIVLRRSDLGETDRILRLFTREAGRVDAVAKGSRRPTSKLSGATELFTYSRMLLALGRSLDIVSQCEIRESFPVLRVDLQGLARATYLCELVERFTEEREPNPEAFDLLLSALYLLQRATDHPDVIVHAFELRLLDERGYRPELGRCVKCGGELDRRRGGFSPSLGGALCSADRFATDDSTALSWEALQLMRSLLHAETEDLLAIAPAPRPLNEAAKGLRWYIRHRTERDVRSADFLDMLRLEASGGRV